MTKSIAEQKILSANGSVTEDGHTLHTCALRLAAIYGPGDQRHIPRIVVGSVVFPISTPECNYYMDSLSLNNQDEHRSPT